MKRRTVIALVARAAVMSMLLPFATEAQRAPYRVGYLALLPNEDATVAAPLFFKGYKSSGTARAKQSSWIIDPPKDMQSACRNWRQR